MLVDSTCITSQRCVNSCAMWIFGHDLENVPASVPQFEICAVVSAFDFVIERNFLFFRSWSRWLIFSVVRVTVSQSRQVEYQVHEYENHADQRCTIQVVSFWAFQPYLSFKNHFWQHTVEIEGFSRKLTPLPLTARQITKQDLIVCLKYYSFRLETSVIRVLLVFSLCFGICNNIQMHCITTVVHDWKCHKRLRCQSSHDCFSCLTSLYCMMSMPIDKTGSRLHRTAHDKEGRELCGMMTGNSMGKQYSIQNIWSLIRLILTPKMIQAWLMRKQARWSTSHWISRFLRAFQPDATSLYIKALISVLIPCQ